MPPVSDNAKAARGFSTSVIVGGGGVVADIVYIIVAFYN
jgi:hypothetical protein